MRYQVPQFVDVEDKIIGPFTLKQFIIYVVAALLLTPVFLLSDLALFFLIAIPVAIVAIAFAHFKVNGKSLFVTLGNVLRYTSKGQLYLWRRDASNKTLPVKGAEYEKDQETSLAQEARALATGGSVVNEDLEDPLAGEE